MWPHRELKFDPETKKPLHIWAKACVTRTGKVIKQQYDVNGQDVYKLYGEKYEADTDVDQPGHAMVVTGFVTGDIGFWMKGARRAAVADWLPCLEPSELSQ